jgi:hypothetical protein
MKKVLIVGHFWPFRSGSFRILGLAKYLKDFGWQPVIVTAPLNKNPDFDIEYIETRYRNFWGVETKKDLGPELRERSKNFKPLIKNYLRFSYNLIREIFAYPDEDKNWRYFALKASEELIKKERINAIISIYPITSHIVANEIKNKYKIPWIADFADLWSSNHNYPYGRIRKFFDHRLEIKTIMPADALVTVSDPLKDGLKNLFKEKEIYAITNGFDPEKINEPAADLTRKFTITYTGQIYKGKQDPFKIFEAIQSLISDGIINRDDIELRFFGPENDLLSENIKKNNFCDIFKQFGVINRDEAIKRQRESQLLLLLNWQDEKQKGVFTGKIFEYLAAKRPIIATGGTRGDVVGRLLEETGAGTTAFSAEDVKKAINNYYLEWKNKGEVEYRGNDLKINKYSYKEMARKFANILDKII